MKRLAPLALAAALAACSSTYEAPEEPEAVPPASASESRELAQLVAALGADDPQARADATTRLERAGLLGVPWLFAGAEDADPERAQGCLALLAKFRQQAWPATPPADDEFIVRLQRSVQPGHPLRVYAFWWIARVCRVEEARRALPDPAPWLTDADPDVRRYAAILHIRYGHDVRRLADVLPEVLEQLLRSPGELEEWEEVLISFCAATFDDAELARVRADLRAFVEKAREYDPELAWWSVRAFFRKAGPAAEPLLRDILLHEAPGDLRRLAAIAYGPGARWKDLVPGWNAGADDDLAIALGNSGRAESVKVLARLLAASPRGSRDRWAAQLALERGSGLWLGDASDEDDGEATVRRWQAHAQGRLPGLHFAVAGEDGGAFLIAGEGGCDWQVGVGVIERNEITRTSPAWAVFRARALDPTTAAADLLAAWTFDSSRFLIYADFLAMNTRAPARPRAERLIARSLATAAGTAPALTLDATVDVIRDISAAALQRDRALLADATAPDADRRHAARRLAFGGPEDAATLAAFLASRPPPASRSAACLSLFQIGGETAFLALAENAADEEAKIVYGGFESPAAAQLLRLRFIEAAGVETCDANGFDPEKWSKTVREAFAAGK